MTDAIIGLDVGTTVVKAVLFAPSGSDPSGQAPSGSSSSGQVPSGSSSSEPAPAGVELGVAAHALPLYTPKPGWAELAPDDIWQAALWVLRG